MTDIGTKSRPSFVIASRYWGSDSGDIKNLASFVLHATKCGNPVVIAINVANDTSNALIELEPTLAPHTLETLNVHLLPVSEWGGITPALNSLLEYVTNTHPKTPAIVFQSVEVHAVPEQVFALVSLVENGAFLVAGGVLEGHSRTGEGGLASRTPWNTFAAWNLQELAISGFPSFVDSVSPPGMEEVAAIATISSRKRGSVGKPALVEFQDRVQWNVVRGEARKEKHLIKMKSKEFRSRELLRLSKERCDAEIEARLCDYKSDWIVWDQYKKGESA